MRPVGLTHPTGGECTGETGSVSGGLAVAAWTAVWIFSVLFPPADAVLVFETTPCRRNHRMAANAGLLGAAGDQSVYSGVAQACHATSPSMAELTRDFKIAPASAVLDRRETVVGLDGWAVRARLRRRELVVLGAAQNCEAGRWMWPLSSLEGEVQLLAVLRGGEQIDGLRR